MGPLAAAEGRLGRSRKAPAPGDGCVPAHTTRVARAGHDRPRQREDRDSRAGGGRGARARANTRHTHRCTHSACQLSPHPPPLPRKGPAWEANAPSPASWGPGSSLALGGCGVSGQIPCALPPTSEAAAPRRPRRAGSWRGGSSPTYQVSEKQWTGCGAERQLLPFIAAGRGQPLLAAGGGRSLQGCHSLGFPNQLSGAIAAG